MATDDPEADDGRDGRGDDGKERTGSRFSLSSLGRLAAWIVGPLLVALGVFGMRTSPMAGVYLVVGLFVTPRTRRELKELCAIWGGGT